VAVDQPSSTNSTPIVVAARSFSRNSTLKAEIQKIFKKVKFNETGKVLAGPELVEFLKDYTHAITGLEVIDESLLRQLPDLKVIGKYGVGLDMLDLEALEKRGILLGWTPGVNRRSVAELTLMMMIALLRHVPVSNANLRSGQWGAPQGGLLTGKTVGIIGCGHVGKELVLLLKPFGCRILVRDLKDFPEFNKEHGVSPFSLDGVLSQSDVVSLHVPLNSSTRGLLSREKLALMKLSAILVNTARGGIVDEVALKEALMGGKLAGAGFDVFVTEPPADLELMNLPNFFGTTHIGANAEEAVLAMGRAAIQGLLSPRSAGEYKKWC